MIAWERARPLDGPAVDLQDHVARLQARLGGRAGHRDAGDQAAAAEPEPIGRRGVDRADGHPEICPADPAELREVGGHPARPAGRDGESHPLVAASVGLDRRVDPATTSPLRFTIGPPELPGLIAASVWIQVLVEGDPDPPALAADDPGGDGAREAERLAGRRGPSRRCRAPRNPPQTEETSPKGRPGAGRGHSWVAPDLLDRAFPDRCSG